MIGRIMPKRKKEQSMIYKALHMKLKIEEHEPHYKSWVAVTLPKSPNSKAKIG